jgi:CheY-like chemotaxis protein
VEDASRKVERGDAATAKTVLLVEDDYDVRDTLQDLLESEGFDVVPAANGKQAIDFLRDAKPGGDFIVVLDLMMPMVSGWEVLELLTRDARLARIPVIVLSALATERPPRAQEFVRKPFTMQALVSSIRNWFPRPSSSGMGSMPV